MLYNDMVVHELNIYPTFIGIPYMSLRSLFHKDFRKEVLLITPYVFSSLKIFDLSSTKNFLLSLSKLKGHDLKRMQTILDRNSELIRFTVDDEFSELMINIIDMYENGEHRDTFDDFYAGFKNSMVISSEISQLFPVMDDFSNENIYYDFVIYNKQLKQIR